MKFHCSFHSNYHLSCCVCQQHLLTFIKKLSSAHHEWHTNKKQQQQLCFVYLWAQFFFSQAGKWKKHFFAEQFLIHLCSRHRIAAGLMAVIKIKYPASNKVWGWQNVNYWYNQSNLFCFFVSTVFFLQCIGGMDEAIFCRTILDSFMQ